MPRPPQRRRGWTGRGVAEGTGPSHRLLLRVDHRAIHIPRPCSMRHSPRRSQADRRSAGDPLHAKARELAEHSRDRSTHPAAPKPGPALCRTAVAGMGDCPLGGYPQHHHVPDRLAWQFTATDAHLTLHRLYPAHLMIDSRLALAAATASWNTHRHPFVWGHRNRRRRTRPTGTSCLSPAA
jgi:hypothetical protein